MPYYSVYGTVEIEEYVKAEDEEEALKKAQDKVGDFINDETITRITKKEYDKWSDDHD